VGSSSRKWLVVSGQWLVKNRTPDVLAALLH